MPPGMPPQSASENGQEALPGLDDLPGLVTGSDSELAAVAAELKALDADGTRMAYVSAMV